MADFREFLQRAGEVVIPGVIGFAAGRLTAPTGEQVSPTTQSLIDIALRGATAALAPSQVGGAVVAARAGAAPAAAPGTLFGLSPVMLLIIGGIILVLVSR